MESRPSPSPSPSPASSLPAPPPALSTAATPAAAPLLPSELFGTFNTNTQSTSPAAPAAAAISWAPTLASQLLNPSPHSPSSSASASASASASVYALAPPSSAVASSAVDHADYLLLTPSVSAAATHSSPSSSPSSSPYTLPPPSNPLQSKRSMSYNPASSSSYAPKANYPFNSATTQPLLRPLENGQHHSSDHAGNPDHHEQVALLMSSSGFNSPTPTADDESHGISFSVGSSKSNSQAHIQHKTSTGSLGAVYTRHPSYILESRESKCYDFFSPVRNFISSLIDTSPPVSLSDFPNRYLDYTSEEAETVVIPYIMELGKALQKCGIPAHRLYFQMDMISKAHGLECNFFSVSGVLFCSFGPSNSISSPLTHLVTVRPGDLDMCKLSDLEQLSEEIALGNIPISQGCEKIKEIIDRPPLYGNLLSALAVDLIAIVVAFLFSGSWWELLASAFVGLYVAFIIIMAGKYAPLGMLVEILSAFGGAIVAAAVSYINSSQISIYLVTLAGIIILVPGLSITISFAEIALRHYVSGIARLFAAIISILQLAGGTLLGVRCAAYLMPSQGVTLPNAPISMPEWAIIFVVFLSAVSMTILLRVRVKSFLLVFISCCLGIVAGRYVAPVLGNDGGTFVGAFTICALGNFSTYVYRHAIASVTIFTGIILLVPGSLGIKAVWAMAEASPEANVKATSNLSSMLMTAMLLVTGLFVANVLVRPRKAL